MYSVFRYVHSKVCRDVQCIVCRHVAIPDGIRLHLGMEILSRWPHVLPVKVHLLHKKQYFDAVFWYSNRSPPDTLVFWYFGHVFWYFGAARHENGFFCDSDFSWVAPPWCGGLHDLRGGVWPIPGNWFLIYSNWFSSLGKFKWLWYKVRRSTTILLLDAVERIHVKVNCNCSKTALGGSLWIGSFSALFSFR